MNWVLKTVTSSIGKKVTMSLTGLFLCTFLAVHLSGNLLLLKSDDGLAFNTYAVFMTSNPLIKTISYGLYALILFHAVMGLYLVNKNNAARKSKYAVSAGNATSFWASRWMGVLGTIILVFIVVHMSDFWFQYKFGHTPYAQYTIDLNSNKILAADTGIAPIEVKLQETYTEQTKTVIVKNLFIEVNHAFKNIGMVLLYIFSMAALSFHLIHGFKSAFQTLGINHNKYNGLIQFLGIWVFGIIIPVLFAFIPIYIYIS